MRHSDNSEARKPSIVLAPLSAETREAFVDLWVASWRETMPSIDFEARRGWIAGVLADPAHVTLAAWRKGLPAGFVTTEGRYLHQLVVAPYVKGTGVATALLAAAKVGGALSLDVNQANTRAVRFYEREGFVKAGAGRNPSSGLATWAMRWPNP